MAASKKNTVIEPQVEKTEDVNLLNAQHMVTLLNRIDFAEENTPTGSGLSAELQRSLLAWAQDIPATLSQVLTGENPFLPEGSREAYAKAKANEDLVYAAYLEAKRIREAIPGLSAEQVVMGEVFQVACAAAQSPKSTLRGWKPATFAYTTIGMEVPPEVAAIIQKREAKKAAKATTTI